jgi:hypothetical protein
LRGAFEFLWNEQENVYENEEFNLLQGFDID